MKDSNTFNAQCPYCLTPYENMDAALVNKKARCVRCRKVFVLKPTSDEDPLLREAASPPAPQKSNDSQSFAPESSYDESSLLNASSSYGSTKRSPRVGGMSASSSVSDSASASERSDDAAASASDSFIDEFQDFSQEDFDRKFPAPPKGIWRPGEILLDGMCQVLPLTRDKLYAEGGVGFVQRVRRRDWNVDLIVKSPKPGVVSTESGKESFERECQTWIELGLHSNIVSCYFVRRIDGIPRLFAELAPDGTLRDWIADKRIYVGSYEDQLAKLLDISTQFAWGLEHAHKQGLLHLDVKPGNVMTSGSTVKVTDFGLSKLATDMESSPSGCEGLTPSYCSPEQFEAFKIYRQRRENAMRGVKSAERSAVPMTKQTDIWSWAISVLAMFYGRSPCKKGGQTAAEVFELFVKTQDANARVRMPNGMIKLLRHCFQKNPADRPESMQYVADRILEIYDEELGRPYPRRQPQNAALTAESFSNKAISLLDLGKTQEAIDLLKRAVDAEPNHPLVVFNQTLALWRDGQLRDLDAVRKLEEIVEARNSDPTALYAFGLLQIERGNLKSGANAFERALELEPKRVDVRRSFGEVQQLRSIDSQCLTQYVLKKTDEKTPPSLFISEDGDYLLIETIDEKRLVLSATNGSPLVSFQQSTDRERFATQKTRRIAVSEDYRWNLLYQSEDALILEPVALKDGSDQSVTILFRRVDWNSCRERVVKFKKRAQVASTDGKKMRSQLVDASIRFVPARNGLEVRNESENRSKLFSDGYALTVFSATDNGEWVATGNEASQIGVWNVEQGRCVRTFQGLGGAVEAVWFDPQKRFVAAVSKGNFCQFFSVSLLCNHSQKIRAPHLLCSFNSSEELIERQTFFEQLIARAQEDASRGNVAAAVDAYRQAQSTEGWEKVRTKFEEILERRATRIDIRDVSQSLLLNAHEGVVSAIATSWNASFLASGGKDAAVRVWTKRAANADEIKSRQWKLLYEFDGHSDWVRSIALSPDGRFLASGSWDQKVILWSLANGAKLRVLPERVKNPSKLAFAPDGRTLAVASANGSISLWDLATNSVATRLHVGEGETRALVFSRDGRYFATATEDAFVRFWNGRSLLAAREIGPFPSPVLSLDITYDLANLVAGCANGKIYIVDLESSSQTALPGHLGEITALKLFSDSERLISVGKDKTIRFWDLPSLREMHKLTNPDGEAADLALDFDGVNFFVGSENGVVREWNIQWDYDANTTRRVDEATQRRVAVLTGYCVNFFPRIENPDLPTFYGVRGVHPQSCVDAASRLSEEQWRAAYEEARWRGLHDLSFETFKEIAARLQKDPTPF